jgi:hypothetical protein
MMRRLALVTILLLGGQVALGEDSYPALPPPGASMGPAQPPNPYAAAWPPPGASMGQPSQFYAQPAPPAGPPAPSAPAYDVGRTSWVAPANSPTPPPVMPVVPATPMVPATAGEPHESTWYYRLDSFFWNERSGGVDFVNEYGPISTVGYVHRSGIERYRFELFGGTVAYYGSAQYLDDQNQVQNEPLHESFGTNYLGCRGEYDLLVEPAAWSKARLVFGVGTRCWIRDLQDTVTSDLVVSGYQEVWCTFYPYVGLETKSTDEPGPQFFGSVRAGFTPLTIQYATLTDSDYPRAGSVVYPRCGFTGQAEMGVRFQKFTASAFLEAFTWGESAIVGDSYQPASRMLTLGGKISYTF